MNTIDTTATNTKTSSRTNTIRIPITITIIYTSHSWGRFIASPLSDYFSFLGDLFPLER